MEHFVIALMHKNLAFQQKVFPTTRYSSNINVLPTALKFLLLKSRTKSGLFIFTVDILENTFFSPVRPLTKLGLCWIFFGQFAFIASSFLSKKMKLLYDGAVKILLNTETQFIGAWIIKFMQQFAFSRSPLPSLNVFVFGKGLKLDFFVFYGQRKVKQVVKFMIIWRLECALQRL